MAPTSTLVVEVGIMNINDPNRADKGKHRVGKKSPRTEILQTEKKVRKP